jgi:predicted TIM-barrel fold metal-dependent hydrolase
MPERPPTRRAALAGASALLAAPTRSQAMSALGTLDVHAHFLPPVYRDALKKAGLKTLDGGIPVPDWSPERALAIMDEIGVAGAVLSVSSPHVSFLPADEARELCRQVNDYAADLCRRYPDRFGAYAILPLPDVDASLAELRRALDELKLDGVALPTHADGAYLGDAKFAPLLAALDARGATVFIHPTAPACFESFGLELPAPMIEFPFDTTRTVASLIFSGALERHPRIRFILPHGGGTLPFLAPRIAGIGAIPVLGTRAKPVPDTLKALARLYYDTALSTAPHQIAALRAIAPVSQILYGTDFPFAPEPFLRAAEAQFQALPFTPQEREQVRSGNAKGLFPAFASRCCGRH